MKRRVQPSCSKLELPSSHTPAANTHCTTKLQAAVPAVACCCTVVRRAKPMHGELWRASAAADTNVTARTRAAGGSTPSHDEGASKVMPAVACHCKIKRQAEAAAWQAVAFAGTRAATCAGAACGRTPLHDEAMSTVVPAAACHRAMKRQAKLYPQLRAIVQRSDKRSPHTDSLCCRRQQSCLRPHATARWRTASRARSSAPLYNTATSKGQPTASLGRLQLMTTHARWP